MESICINQDIFSAILTHISDAKCIHRILLALTSSHHLFPVALVRLCHLPIYFDSYDPRTAAASQQVLDYLLNGECFPVESIRHLVVSITHEPTLTPGFENGRHIPRRPGGPTDAARAAMLAIQDQLASLLQRTTNLRSLDYHSYPGFALKNDHLRALQRLPNVTHFAVDCALRSRDIEIPASGGSYAAPGELSAQYDAEIWGIDMLASTIGPTITSLELRHVNHTMFNSLKEHTSAFASYDALEDIKLDITEGVWDWLGGGSPAMGASPEFQFPRLGFPSVKRFELVVCDKTLQQPQIGPLNLIDCRSLTELVLDVRYSLWWADWWNTVKLFEALSPSDLPALEHLEIKDRTRNTERHYWDNKDNNLGWKHMGRVYTGLVPSFLGSTSTGLLPRLTRLWVDEKVLLPPRRSVHVVLSSGPGVELDSDPEVTVWYDALKSSLWQLESLRVGMGALTYVTAELLFSLCDRNKLTQFGFEWKWRDYGRQDPISPRLLSLLSRCPKLTDVHILFPRPQTELTGRPDPDIDALTLADVKSIFRCNGSICRVGIGDSVVWERDTSTASGPSAILLVSDGSIGSNPAVPRFFHAGYVAKDLAEVDPSDTAVAPRPDRGEEIELLRDLLQSMI